MKTIKGVVFDFGGVIALPQDPTFYQWMLAQYGWKKETIWAGWKRHRALMDGGEISIAEMYRRIFLDAGITLSAKDLTAIGIADYDSWARPNIATYQWAKELKAQGYKVGILTNMPPDYLPWFDKTAHDFRCLADAEVISGIEHMIKPERPIYDLMAQRMGLSPTDLLFLDDTLVNVEAAQRYGWHSALFTDVDSARKALME